MRVRLLMSDTELQLYKEIKGHLYELSQSLQVNIRTEVETRDRLKSLIPELTHLCVSGAHYIPVQIVLFFIGIFTREKLWSRKNQPNFFYILHT